MNSNPADEDETSMSSHDFEMAVNELVGITPENATEDGDQSMEKQLDDEDSGPN